MVREGTRNAAAATNKQGAPGREPNRGGLFSRFVNCLKKKNRRNENSRSKMTPTNNKPVVNRSALQKNHEVAPSPSPHPQDQQHSSSYFNPNWDDFALAGPVDLDELSSTDEDPCTSSSSEGSQEKLDNRLTVMYQPGDDDYASLRLQPLSRRILVDLAEAVEILEETPAGPERFSKRRSGGNASLGESQPRQPARHHHHFDDDKYFKKNDATPSKRKNRRGTTTENIDGDAADDLSSCSGITMDSGFDSTIYGHGESILASLLAPPRHHQFAH